MWCWWWWERILTPTRTNIIYICKHPQKIYYPRTFYFFYVCMKKLFIVGISTLLLLWGCTQQSSSSLDSFAQCLTEKWAIMYGSVNCSYCQAQKKMFGDSFQYINYVECTEEFERCATISGVPTREFSDGTLLEGRQSLSALAKAADCELPLE